MAYSNDLREEELKNRVRDDYFQDYDPNAIIGNIDFAVATPVDKTQPQLFKQHYFLWAECKRGTKHNIYEALVQLIITIGKARTFDRLRTSPAYLGAFDAEKMAFIPFHQLHHIFYQNDFNWNVTPSNHDTPEFKQVYAVVKTALEEEMLLYYYDRNNKQLRKFITQNFIVDKANTIKTPITKNTFITDYREWVEEVKPSIAIDWEAAKKENILDADFFLADLLSMDNLFLKDKLYVLLKSDRYQYNIHRKSTGSISFDEVTFNDNQVAHTQFWNRYQRPPKEDYWDYILDRRDLLIPQEFREIKGAYYTPRIWVEKSQAYLAEELGEDWQEEYYIWDCCAGTGNLENGLMNKSHIWASTLDEQDVKVMHDRIAKRNLNLSETHVFQFDFLNGDFKELPDSLKRIINDPEKRQKLIIYINPPYHEAPNAKTLTGTGKHQKNVAVSTKMYQTAFDGMQLAGRELYAQFFVRIYNEIPGCILAEFSTLKILQAPDFAELRKFFQARLGRSFIVPAQSFDNVAGQFPIGFFIWHLSEPQVFTTTISHVYNRKGESLPDKILTSYDTENTINQWIITTRNREKEKIIGFMSAKGNDFQTINMNYITRDKATIPHPRGTMVTDKNLTEICIYYAVRHSVKYDWLKDRDQFLFPNDGWKSDAEFQADCMAYTLFNTNITRKHGINDWIPFTEMEVDAPDEFESHFLSDFLRGKIKSSPQHTRLFDTEQVVQIYDGSQPVVFSAEAQAVMDAGREVWRYYHAVAPQRENASFPYNPNAAYYDIKGYFKGFHTDKRGTQHMNHTSPDEHFNQLSKRLADSLNHLAEKIVPKVYEYGFLK